MWEPQWARDELTRSAFRRRLRQYQRELREDQGYAFFILRASDAALVGGLSVSNVRRGVAQAASIGYWIGAPHAGRGLHDGARARRAALHLRHARAQSPGGGLPAPQRRLRGACWRRSGFRREGLARRYLKINGAWQDHDLYALLHDDARGVTTRGRMRDAADRAGKARRARCARRACALALLARARCSLLCGMPSAFALKAIEINNDAERIEISALGEGHDPHGDTLQIETVPGADGVRGRMSVQAATPGTNPSWFVFALTNATDKPVERWLVADRYATVGSGMVWPDLDARRIDAVTPSVGYVPERIKNDRADVFRLTLEAGQTVTFVAELASDRFTRLYLWKALEYEQKNRDRQLFNGIMLGITGLLAIFLTAVFAANHKAIFPAAAVFTWCVLAYLCVDFGFWHKLFNVRPEENAQYRAAGEAAMAAALLVFLHTFLRLGSWHGFVRMLLGLWIAAQLVLVAMAFVDPRLAATFARLSSIAIAGIGAAAHAVPGAARPGSRAVAGADVDAAARVAVRRRRDLHRPAVRRHRRVRPDRGAGADRRADRLHRHPVRVPHHGAALWRAAGRAAAAVAGHRRRRRRRVGMERAPRRDQGEPGRRGDAGPQGRASCPPRPTTSPSTCIPPTASASSCCCGR